MKIVEPSRKGCLRAGPPTKEHQCTMTREKRAAR